MAVQYTMDHFPMMSRIRGGLIITPRNMPAWEVAQRSEPRYPAMTDKTPLYSGLLTRRGTDCAF